MSDTFEFGYGAGVITCSIFAMIAIFLNFEWWMLFGTTFAGILYIIYDIKMNRSKNKTNINCKGGLKNNE